MKEYLLIKEACVKVGITAYMLNKLIEEGKVRVKETSDISRHSDSRLRYVCLQDILDAQSGLELRFMDIGQVMKEYGITPNAVRHQIRRRRLRWRRNGVTLQPCVSDLELFIREARTKPAGQPESAIIHSA